MADELKTVGGVADDTSTDIESSEPVDSDFSLVNPLLKEQALSHKIVDKTHFIYCAIVRYLQILL